MTAEEMKCIEALTEELKILNKRMKVLSLLKLSELKLMRHNSNDTRSTLVRINSGLEFLDNIEETIQK